MKDLIIEQDIRIYASAAWIWKALTDPSEIENWWSDEVVLEAKVGGAFREVWEDDDGKKQLASGKVLKLKNNEFITFTWREKDWPKTANTQCTLTIQDQGKHRTLTVAHAGWETLPEADRTQTMKDFKVGWNYHLKELQAYLDD
jgi:uncharacterized protein YndB with AHSA1/START domain